MTKNEARIEVAYDILSTVFQDLCNSRKIELAEELSDVMRRIILFSQRVKKEGKILSTVQQNCDKIATDLQPREADADVDNQESNAIQRTSNTLNALEKTLENEKPCKWEKDGFCVNHDSPARADWCPVPDMPGVCRHEERAKPLKDWTLEEAHRLCIALDGHCKECCLDRYICSAIGLNEVTPPGQWKL